MTRYKYGDLNKVEVGKFGEEIPVTSNNSLAQVRKMLQDSYDQKIDYDGEFVGFILSKVEDAEMNISGPQSSWFDSGFDKIKDNIIDFFRGADPTEYMRFRVRVPEIHSSIPEPSGPDDEAGINLHDIFFIPKVEGDELGLAVNDLVVVSFKDGQGRQIPRILKKYSKAAPLPGNDAQAEKAYTSAAVDAASIGASTATSEDFSTLKDHTGKTIVELVPASYTENRVRINEAFTSLPPNSPLLVDVGRGVKLHSLVATRFKAMQEAAATESIEIKPQSGWRKRKWASVSDYEADIRRKYVDNPESKHFYQNYIDEANGNESQARSIAFRKGKGTLAYKSAHETGMAIDVVVDPVEPGDVSIRPDSNSAKDQEKTAAFRWLKQNAHKFGFTPLLHEFEPWHYECLLPINSWKTGEEFTSRYDVIVKEKSIANGKLTSRRDFTYE